MVNLFSLAMAEGTKLFLYGFVPAARGEELQLSMWWMSVGSPVRQPAHLIIWRWEFLS